MTGLSLVDKICKVLLVLFIIGIILLILFQTLIQFEAIRHFLIPLESWEGERLTFA